MLILSVQSTVIYTDTGREQAWITNKVKICSMDLAAAMMLTLRGRRPFLILTYFHDKEELKKRQHERMQMVYAVADETEKRSYMADKTTLQVIISCRILVTGILNEIMSKLPDLPVQNDSAFLLESECSLFLDSETRQAAQTYSKALKLSNILDNLRTSSSELNAAATEANVESLSSFYYQRGNDADMTSSNVSQDDGRLRTSLPKTTNGTLESRSQRFTSTTSSNVESTHSGFRGSKKSVSFTGASKEPILVPKPISGVMPANSSPNEVPQCPCWDDADNEQTVQDKSENMKPKSAQQMQPKASSNAMASHSDLWQAFLADIGCITNETNNLRESIDQAQVAEILLDSIFEYLGAYIMVPTETRSCRYQDYYEEIHALNPGCFWDTVPMDNPDIAFRKMKNILRNIVESQKQFKPMFNINFVDLAKDYPHIEKRLNSIYKEIAPQKLFN